MYTNNKKMDIGANLTDKQFHQDLNQVIDDAFNEGIVSIIVTGTSVQNSWNASQLVNRYKDKYKNRLYSTAGIHPHDAKSYNEEKHNSLDMYLKFSNIVAVGECGLDFNRNFSSHEDQIRCFKAHIELALKHKLPLFIHERDAFDKTIEIFDEYLDKLKENHINVVIHCFTGNSNQVKEYIKRGFYIGITGWITDRRRNSDLVEALEYIPLDRLMVETDSPYLTPHKAKKRRNEPQFLFLVLDEIAKLKNKPQEQIKSITIDNTINFFNLPGYIRTSIFEGDNNESGVMTEKIIHDNNSKNSVENMWNHGDTDRYDNIFKFDVTDKLIEGNVLDNLPIRPDSRRSSRPRISQTDSVKHVSGSYRNKVSTIVQKDVNINDECEFPPLGKSIKKNSK